MDTKESIELNILKKIRLILPELENEQAAKAFFKKLCSLFIFLLLVILVDENYKLIR